MGKTYLSHTETGGDEAAAKDKITFQRAARCFVKRKLGQTTTNETAPSGPPKRRRTKSYQMIMQIDNMLRGLGKDITEFHIPKDAEGNWLGDPFEWPAMGILPDRGSDMVCTDHFLGYEASINCACDYDPSHDGKNVGKNTLKTVNLWSHQVPT